MEEFLTRFYALNNGQVMLLCLVIFLCVLIFPRLMKRKRIQRTILEKAKKGQDLKPEDFKGKNKLFYTHNAQKSEVEEFLARLKTFAFKHEMKIVFPGHFQYHGKSSPTTMILVGKFGLLLIRCYGFGGQIYQENKGKRWMQNMNEVQKEITNPERSMDSEQELMNLLLRQTPYHTVSVYTASVFTRSNVILNIPKDVPVFDRSGIIRWLENTPLFQSDCQVPVKALSDYLVENIKLKKG